MTASDFDNLMRTTALMNDCLILDETNRVLVEVLDLLSEKIAALYAAKASGESEPFKVTT